MTSAVTVDIGNELVVTKKRSISWITVTFLVLITAVATALMLSLRCESTPFSSKCLTVSNEAATAGQQSSPTTKRSEEKGGLVLHLKKVSSLPLNAKHCHVGVRGEKHSLNISALVQNLTLKSHIRVTHTTLGSLGNYSIDIEDASAERFQHLSKCLNTKECESRFRFSTPIFGFSSLQCTGGSECLFGSDDRRQWFALFEIAVDFGETEGIDLGALQEGASVAEQASKKKGSCFPSGATVFTPSGPMQIKDVRVGDELMSEDGSFSSVYLIGHKDNSAVIDFIKITALNGQSVLMSPFHFIQCDGQYMFAKDVKPNMTVTMWQTSTRKDVKIMSVESVSDVGLHNPYTMSGSLIVDGFAVSAHSEWFLEDYVGARYIPSIYQMLLSPIRLLHSHAPHVTTRFAQHFENSALPLDQQSLYSILLAVAFSVI